MLRINQLSDRILEAVRAKAKECTTLHCNAVVRVAVVALSNGAYWALEQDPDKSYEVAMPLSSNVRFDSEQIHGDLNCYGFSALKLALCMHNELKGYGSTSFETENENEDFLTADNGYGHYKGCVCWTIYHRVPGVSNSSEPWAKVFVCVCGGHQDEDELCALAAEKAIKKDVSDELFIVSRT